MELHGLALAFLYGVLWGARFSSRAPLVLLGDDRAIITLEVFVFGKRN